MVHLNYTYYYIIIASLLGCNQNLKINSKNLEDHAKIETFEIDPEMEYQGIDNFGTSDVLSLQNIDNWPKEKWMIIITWLFHIENNDEGNPRGIGFSLWHFY